MFLLEMIIHKIRLHQIMKFEESGRITTKTKNDCILNSENKRISDDSIKKAFIAKALLETDWGKDHVDEIAGIF